MGRLADANTLSNAWRLLKMSSSALTSDAASDAAKYWPPPCFAIALMKFGYSPSLDAPTTAMPCVVIDCTPGCELTSTPRRNRVYSSAQFAWSLLLMYDVGYRICV